MAISELSKICICIATLLSLATNTIPSQAQPLPSFTNDTIPTDDELYLSGLSSSSSPSPSPENPIPENGGYSVSSGLEYNPPPAPPQPYIDTLSPEYQDNLLSPDYSPSPAPNFQEYPSPPPYIEVEAPENYYDFYSPLKAPSPAPYSEFSDTADDSIYSPNLAPQPNVLPFNYRAEDENGEFDEQQSDEDYYSDQNKNRGTMVGFVLGAVCLVGLAGFVYKKKKKHNKLKSEYEYELTKREDI